MSHIRSNNVSASSTYFFSKIKTCINFEQDVSVANEMWTEEKEVSTFDPIENISDFGLLGFAWCENSKNLKKKVAKRASSIVHRSNIM
ncbi:hypothetical protein Y032_0002g1151 [Ancylostoma ceylanicum]|uniref:Uncharacterized protein n=1 Tax=Ancylostoma ceylanicum TaxID=53326 RepID=A0A016W1K0_9BILA|nr:hypothetical protein Y032_0002g1151 [Ancylostoma ceylanicum]